MSLLSKLKLFALFICLVASLFIAPQARAQECATITGAPDLYQVDRTLRQATIYFTPVSGATKYIVGYGTALGSAQNSVTFDYGATSGAISYTINDLQPTVKYYFQVRAANSCSEGPWSNWRGDTITPTPTGRVQASAGMPVTGNESLLAIFVSIPLIFAGFYFLRRNSA